MEQHSSEVVLETMENIPDNTDESFLRWRIGIEESDHSVELEEYGSEQLLKTVVRTSYLYHLRQSLRKNLEACKSNANHAVEEALVNKVIKGCSALLEEKALRHCMIAKLYQRMMAQTIKDVKKATSDSILYSPLKEFAEMQSKVPTSNFVHKEVQTDAIIINSIDSLTRNEIMKQKVNSKEEFAGTSNLNDKAVSANVNERIQSFLNDAIVMNGVLFDSKPMKLNGALNVRTNQTKSISMKKKVEKSVKGNNVNKNVFGFSDEEKPINSGEAITTLKTAEVPAGVINKNTFEVKLRSAAFAESVAIWYNLECEIEDLPPLKKQKLEEKFVNIFGADHAVDYYQLTSEQKSIACRKRIAKFVVMELTNYYVKKRIVSKQLFKTLAKHITSVLLGRSLYPSVEEVKKSVEEFFLDGRLINSEEDFYF